MSTPAAPAKRKPKDPQPVEWIVFGRGGGPEEPSWVEMGRVLVAERFEAKARDAAEQEVVDTLPADEQNGPFATIRAEHWQPRSYETEVVTVRRPVATP